MPCLADATEQCQPRCLQQHPSVTGTRLAAAAGTYMFGSAGISRWWVAFAGLAAGRVDMGCCCLARGVQDKTVTLPLRWETLLPACCVCPSVLALPAQPFAWQTISRGHGSSRSRHGTVLGSSRSRQVLFPLAGVERGASLFGNSPFLPASTCCLLSLHGAKQPSGLLFCPCRVLGGAGGCREGALGSVRGCGVLQTWTGLSWVSGRNKVGSVIWRPNKRLPGIV